MLFWKHLKYSAHIMFHPFDGFWDLKHEKRGGLGGALFIVASLALTYILKRQFTGFVFNYQDPERLNIFVEVASILIPFILWCTSNWCLTTLMDGEGSFKDIVITSGYALAPLVLLQLPLIPLSLVVTVEEGAFYFFFSSLAVIWSGALIVLGTMIVHQYTMLKTLFTIVLIIVGMGLLTFIGLLVFSVLQQMFGLVYIIYRELLFRL